MPPVPGYRDTLPREALAMLEHMGQVSAIGGPEKLRTGLQRFIERTRADEIIVSGAIWDPEARKHSLALTMAALR